jgi:hypothetical protein
MVLMITQVTKLTIPEWATFVIKVRNVSNHIAYKCTYVFIHSALYSCPAQRKLVCVKLKLKSPASTLTQTRLVGISNCSRGQTDVRMAMTKVIVAFSNYFANAPNN